MPGKPKRPSSLTMAGSWSKTVVRTQARPAPFGISVAAAIACALVLYLPFNDQWNLLFLGLACIFCGAGIAILPFREGFSGKFPALLLVSLGIGTVFGIVLLAQLEISGKREHTGIPLASISSIEARLMEDSMPVKNNLTIYKVTVLRAKSGTLSAESRFKAILIGSEGSPMLDKGSLIRTEALFTTGRDGTPQAFVKSAGLHTYRFADTIDKIRSDLKSGLLARMDNFPEASGAFFRALFLGVKDDLDSSITDLFRRSGCLHVLALSGQHLSILAALVSMALAGITGKKAAMIIGVVIVSLYTFIVGTQPSILRAAVMYVLFAFASIADRRADALSTLAAAFFVMASIDPESVYSYSFILSFLAIFGLIAFSKIPSRFFRKWMPLPLADAVGASVGAQFSTLPVSLFAFGALYPGAVVATVSSGPIVPVYIWTGMAATAWNFLPFPFNPFIPLLDIEYRLFMWAIETGTIIPVIVSTNLYVQIMFCAAALFILVCFYAIPCMKLYWRPEHGTSGLRFPHVLETASSGPGLYDAKKVRPEFSGEQDGAGENRFPCRSESR